jgi:hypothetical protein
MYNPQDLPEVDKVAVLILGPHYAEGKKRLFTGFEGFPIYSETIITHDELIEQIADLWRRLESGEQARCHVPPYCLRFFQNNVQLLEASICWQCKNIWLNLADKKEYYKFNADAIPAQQLLTLLRKLSGYKYMTK